MKLGQTSTKGPEEKIDLPKKTEAEKLASIDSCIGSSLKMLRQDIDTRMNLSRHSNSGIMLNNALNLIENWHKYAKEYETL